MSAALPIRPATAADGRACFGVLRRSLADLMARTGYGSVAAGEPEIDAAWPRYMPLFGHLAATCAQWWIAEGPDGAGPVGYARSIERGGTLELTEFFVLPDLRVAGVGRALLDRAFGLGLGERRAVIATIDAPALALYLQFGVAHQSAGVDVTGTPRAVALPDGYEAAPATIDDVLAIEARLLGHAREPEVRFMLADRPAAILRRDGRPVAYAFEAGGHGFAGPVAALEPEHLPAALAHVERAAHAAGHERLDLTLPLAAHEAARWLVGERRFRIDPFYCLFLADGPWAKLDRYLPFNPCLLL